MTGCAGFIGSTLTEALLTKGYHVSGVDCFTGNYDKWIKLRNIESFIQHPHFSWLHADLRRLDLSALLQNKHYIFHQAAMPGVRSSWGENFKTYVDLNIMVTQKLLEAVRKSNVGKVVYASSSSIYGSMTGSTKEEKLPTPYSPYGVTKLSAEHLCNLYFKNYGVPIISLRYFTVYGPRQRPDMAFHKFIKNIIMKKPIMIYGDGKQTRDYTYIDDAVEANLLAIEKGKSGEVYNIGGKSRIELLEVIRILETIIGEKAILEYIKDQPGDPKHTWANIEKAQTTLGYNPSFSLMEGLKNEVTYIQKLYHNSI